MWFECVIFPQWSAYATKNRIAHSPTLVIAKKCASEIFLLNSLAVVHFTSLKSEGQGYLRSSKHKFK